MSDCGNHAPCQTCGECKNCLKVALEAIRDVNVYICLRNKRIMELEGLLKEIVINDSVQVYPGAIEQSGYGFDFKAWAGRVIALLPPTPGEGV